MLHSVDGSALDHLWLRCTVYATIFILVCKTFVLPTPLFPVCQKISAVYIETGIHQAASHILVLSSATSCKWRSTLESWSKSCRRSEVTRESWRPYSLSASTMSPKNIIPPTSSASERWRPAWKATKSRRSTTHTRGWSLISINMFLWGR